MNRQQRNRRLGRNRDGDPRPGMQSDTEGTDGESNQPIEKKVVAALPPPPPEPPIKVTLGASLLVRRPTVYNCRGILVSDPPFDFSAPVSET